MSESKAMYSIPVARQIKFGSACISNIHWINRIKKTSNIQLGATKFSSHFSIVYLSSLKAQFIIIDRTWKLVSCIKIFFSLYQVCSEEYRYFRATEQTCFMKKKKSNYIICNIDRRLNAMYTQCRKAISNYFYSSVFMCKIMS